MSAKYSEVGARIKQLRNKAGMTQGELGKAIGISGSYVGLIEAGRRRLERDRCVLLAEALATDANDILLGFGWAPLGSSEVSLDEQYEYLLDHTGAAFFDDIPFSDLDEGTKRIVVQAMETMHEQRKTMRMIVDDALRRRRPSKKMRA